jgi:hypothetical protein
MSYQTDKRGIMKQLKEIKGRKDQGIHLHKDSQAMVRILMHLTNMVYDPLIQMEKADELHEQIMSEMDWMDLQD